MFHSPIVTKFDCVHHNVEVMKRNEVKNATFDDASVRRASYVEELIHVQNT